MLPSHDRFKYSGIRQRPVFDWPDGKRLAVYIAVNIEHFPFGVQCGVDLDRQTQPWSQRSWLWREYGNRVGGWRLLDLFDELGIQVGVIANTEFYHHCPELIAAHRDRGDELIAHGRSNAERQIEMDEATELGMIREVTAFMEQADGKRPQGWLSPYLTPSLATTDLLEKTGYSYVLDWGICDEQPFWVDTCSKRPVLSIPYPIELNDQPAIAYRHNSAGEYCDMIVENFDEMLKRSSQAPLVCAISLHSFIMGQPFRLSRLRKALQHILAHRDQVWMTVPNQVAAHYRALPVHLQLAANLP